MIFWIASYPKSGNTWLRALISSYYYTNDGVFKENIIKNIGQFPEKKFFSGFNYDPKIVTDTTRFWIKAQERINEDHHLRFFKTHNVFGKLNDYDFTDSKNSIGCIYVVRDPRNVITSIKNHYELNDDQAFKWMLNEKNYIYDVSNLDKDGYSDFQFISSWSNHYKTWLNSNPFKKILIKYEDLQLNSHNIFRELIKFTNDLLGFDKHIDDKKFTNAIETTNFENLKKEEIKGKFSENVYSDQGKKINFFHLGFKNKWEKLLPANIRSEANKQFEKDIKHFNYTT